MTEAKTKREQAQDIASEMGEFSMRELASELADMGIFNASDDESDLNLGRIKRAKGLLKEHDKDGCPVFVAISTGPGALWKKWVQCTRVESRRSMQILACGIKDYDRTLKGLKAAHEKRFKEIVTVPRTTDPRGWEYDSETPPVSR